MSLEKFIAKKWSHRLDSGTPNPKNPSHVAELSKMLLEWDIPYEGIQESISRLTEEQEFYARSKKSGKIVKYTNKNNYESGIEDGSHEKVDQDDAAREFEKQDGDESKPEKKPQLKMSKSGGFDGGDSTDVESQPVDSKPPSDDLRNKDHQTTDSQLNLSVADAKAQAEKKGKKGVGAGTAESRAGEAAVHYTLRKLLEDKNIEDIKSELMNLANDKDKILNKKWVEAAVNTAQWINNVYGDDIEEVVWDTPEGRELIDAEGHGTSADMFIKTKDGKNIGISLKQTTNVFLLNGGYKKQHEMLIDSLSETLSPSEIEEFKSKTSIETYKTGFNNQLTGIRNLFSADENFKNKVLQRVENYKNMSDDEFKKIFDSTKYQKYLDNIENILSKLPHVKGEEMKFVAKLVKDGDIRKSFPDLYDNLRGEEIKLTQSILTEANSNQNVAKGIKKLCLDGMHVEDILFGKSDKLDEFITLYGNNPAVELDKGVLLKIFDMQDEYEQYMSLDNDEDREEFKQQLIEKMNDKIVIDIKDGARSGEIKIKHQNGEFHLFGVKARTKPLGTSPGLEMNQTSFMGNVIKEGTPEVSEWKSSTKKRFVNARVKEIMEDIEDANEEQKRALLEEIEKLKSIL